MPPLPPPPKPRKRPAGQPSPEKTTRRYAVIGAGMAGVACARTLAQAGHAVTVFEQADQAGGRTRTLQTSCGSFDAGAQYFTVRDARFEQALATVPGLCRPWSANAVRVLDQAGRVISAAPAPGEPHWVAQPTMDALVGSWAQPLQRLHTGRRVMRLTGRRGQWQIHWLDRDGMAHADDNHDAVVFALPAPQVAALLGASRLQTRWLPAVQQVTIAPCWTLMLAFAQAVRPGLTTLGPQWNAAHSTHHRITWLARESSKPGRSHIERWTVQASPRWSQEHLHDSAARVHDKLLKAFAEITGIRATPSDAQVHLWAHAQTHTPLGQPFAWDADTGLGACGDWCLGHRLEDAFVSGLELALTLA